MAGIYIHIPFCRQACHYCDFHFSTNLTLIEDMINSLGKELVSRRGYLNEPVQSVYFGGGTPSILDPNQISFLLRLIKENYQLDDSVEITLEANPEDLDQKKLQQFQADQINRLSIGIQSFSNSQLQWMNRVHNSDQSTEAFKLARDSGFNNISLDLIYAIPKGEPSDFDNSLSKLVELNPEHISIYGLTIEERTVFGKYVQRGTLEELDEEIAATQYLATIEHLESHGYRQYEVSNFSKPGFESKHNSSYWSGKPYLGVGPGAHSYDGRSRQFNIRNNARYIKALQQNDNYFDREDLSSTQLMNERILTSLRTINGIDLSGFSDSFEIDLQAVRQQSIGSLIDQGIMVLEDQYLKLTRTGFLVADEIALKLFFEE